MDKITALLQLAEDSELPDTLTVWDICRLSYPEDQRQQQRFLEFLTRHIAKGTLATAGAVDLLEKDRPGYSVVTATILGGGNPFRTYWEPRPPPPKTAVFLVCQSALWGLLDRTAFQPSPGPYLARWRDPTATPALTSPAPAAPLVDHQARSGGDSEAAMSARLSNEALGADTRNRLRESANRAKELHDVRRAEWQRWYDKAMEFHGNPDKKPNFSHLARRVKKALGLPDSISTIRQKLGEIHRVKFDMSKKI